MKACQAFPEEIYMRKATLVLLAFGCAMAEDEAARHKEWMDTAQDLTYDLKDALDAKSSERAAEPTEKLVKLGEREEEYWTKAKLHDAVKLARQNLAASRAVAAAAKDGQFDRALQAYAELQTSCRSCHDLHFEKRLAQTHP
jgi:cytochrome c556